MIKLIMVKRARLYLASAIPALDDRNTYRTSKELGVTRKTQWSPLDFLSDFSNLFQSSLWEEKKVALVFVGPEAPLCAGLADALNAKGGTMEMRWTP